MLDNPVDKVTVVFTVHVPCSLYHCTCTDLEPFVLNVRDSLSSDVSSLPKYQDLSLCPGLTEFVQTVCGAPLVMLGYVCKHVYIYVSWNYSCC